MSKKIQFLLLPLQSSFRRHSFNTEVVKWGSLSGTVKVLQEIPNAAKNSKNGCSVFKWQPKKHLKLRDINILAKNGKTVFPKEFFHKIWLIIKNVSTIMLLK